LSALRHARKQSSTPLPRYETPLPTRRRHGAHYVWYPWTLTKLLSNLTHVRHDRHAQLRLRGGIHRDYCNDVRKRYVHRTNQWPLFYVNPNPVWTEAGMSPQYDTVRLMLQSLIILHGRTTTTNPSNWAAKEDNSDRVRRRCLHFSEFAGGRANHPRGHRMLREGKRRHGECRKIESVRGGQFGYFMRYNGHNL